MHTRDRIKQIREDFNRLLDQKKIETAMSFFTRCTEKEFEDSKELIEIKRFKEACDIARNIFEENLDKVLGGE